MEDPVLSDCDKEAEEDVDWDRQMDKWFVDNVKWQNRVVHKRNSNLKRSFGVSFGEIYFSFISQVSPQKEPDNVIGQETIEQSATRKGEVGKSPAACGINHGGQWEDIFVLFSWSNSTLKRLLLDSPSSPVKCLNPLQPTRWRSRVNHYTADGQPEIICHPKRLGLVPSRKADSIILQPRWCPSGGRLANSATINCPLGVCWPSSSPARWDDTKYLSAGRELQLWAHRTMVLVRGWSLVRQATRSYCNHQSRAADLCHPIVVWQTIGEPE